MEFDVLVEMVHIRTPFLAHFTREFRTNTFVQFIRVFHDMGLDVFAQLVIVLESSVADCAMQLVKDVERVRGAIFNSSVGI